MPPATAKKSRQASPVLPWAAAPFIVRVIFAGVFRFSNTSQKTMEIAGKLITYGFDFPMLLDETFYVKTYVQSRFQAQVLLNARRSLEDRVIVGTADKMFMDAMGAGKDDTDGAVNELRNIHGIECAVFIYEKTKRIRPGGSAHVFLSLQSVKRFWKLPTTRVLSLIIMKACSS